MRGMLRLLELVLAVLGGWDIARRLSPVRVPVLLGEMACAGLGAILYLYAEPVIILALCVPGALLLLATILSPAPHVPWGPRAMEIIRLYRQRHRQGMHESHPARKVGNRIPPL